MDKFLWGACHNIFLTQSLYFEMGPLYASEIMNLNFKDWAYGKKWKYNCQISRTKKSDQVLYKLVHFYTMHKV